MTKGRLPDGRALLQTLLFQVCDGFLVQLVPEVGIVFYASMNFTWLMTCQYINLLTYNKGSVEKKYRDFLIRTHNTINGEGVAAKNQAPFKDFLCSS